MILPTKAREIKRKSPKVLTLFGPTKVGKTTMVSKLEGGLLIDTEHGAEKVKGLIVEINNLEELRDLIKALTEKNPYKYLALDTIDNIVHWVEENICDRRKVKAIGDIPYGAGYDEVRSTTFKIIYSFSTIAPLIIVGHRKRTIIGSEKLEVKVDSLDLTGKLKGMIMAYSDAVGYVFRDNDKPKISFKGDDTLETGSRCEHLANKIIDFDWNLVFID